MKTLHNWLQTIWYGDGLPPWYLRILSKLYGAYQNRLSAEAELTREPKPVIVVGNVVAGGSGKTPLVIYLAELVMREGLNVAVIGRIYKGNANGPLRVNENTGVQQVGDEPVLLYKRLSCPVVVSKDRSKAIDFIIKKIDCDIIISDDGLQHRQLPRAVEIGVMDGLRKLGNGHLLPAGPLREPAKRLNRCQWLVSKGGGASGNLVNMQLETRYAVNLQSGERKLLSDFSGQQVSAIAGIGHPQSFFESLQSYGLIVEAYPFPDHYHYTTGELLQLDGPKPLLMTEKDAVKCHNMKLINAWYVPLQIELPETFNQAFIARCRALLEY